MGNHRQRGHRLQKTSEKLRCLQKTSQGIQKPKLRRNVHQNFVNLVQVQIQVLRVNVPQVSCDCAHILEDFHGGNNAGFGFHDNLLDDLILNQLIDQAITDFDRLNLSADASIYMVS